MTRKFDKKTMKFLQKTDFDFSPTGKIYFARKEAETANDANSSEAEAVPAEKKTAGVSDNQEADPAEAKETKKNTDTTKNTDNSAEKTDANPEADATPATEDSEKK